MLTKNWTVRVEGLYADFDDSSITTISGFGGTYRSKFTHALTTVRAGLNWKW
jgi:opacity protein-like surface antigen